MILIAFTLSLLAIVAGMFLLAKTKSETLGKFFKFVSWFVIIMGFLCIVCLSMRCMKHCCSREEGHSDKCEHYKEMRGGEGRHCMQGKEESGEMEEGGGHHDGMMKGCCKMGKEAGKHCMKDSSATK